MILLPASRAIVLFIKTLAAISLKQVYYSLFRSSTSKTKYRRTEKQIALFVLSSMI